MSLLAHWRRCFALRARGNIHSMVCGKAGLITLRCFGDMSDQSYWNNFYSSCQDETFSLALDKGTSDAVLKGPKGDVAFADVLHECLRVLKPRGKLIQFSDEPPELRLGALEKVTNDFVQTYSTGLNSSKLRLSWRELSTQSIFQHYLYVVHKEGVGEHR
ncbi:uncharacterized protein LOC111328172 isoform X3 [Stylophora pistillata]|uniref:uncharacterized protein LOC111328172 isoform X3 n=1 Tax=Stylophora pistillata TaxID=50429 RepID=UPI000C0528B7|nr:uncharacterized protein LOC111328172 isoform X3 [Stylophora pistillata]